MSATTTSPPSIEQLGRYALLSELGRSPIAITYKAFDPQLDRTVALKVLQPQWSRDAESRTRFLREIKGACTLSHAGIVTVFEAGEHDDRLYVVHELVDGPTLGEALRTGTPPTLDEAVDIVVQIARALDYAHRKGVVHGELRPVNIIISRSGRITARLAEFGLVRACGSEASRQLRAEDAAATAPYVAPEQISGRSADARCDLYAAGALLDQMLRAIDERADAPEGRASPPAAHAGAALRRVIERALDKQPAARFQSGEEMAHALLGAVRAPGRSARPRLSLAPRWAGLVALGAFAVLALAALLALPAQRETALRHALGQTAMLAKLIAAQSAPALLAQDRQALDVQLQGAAQGQAFEYLLVLDHEASAQASVPAALAASALPTPGEALVPTGDAAVEVRTVLLSDRREGFDYSAPVRFQDRRIGTLRLGIARAALDADASALQRLLATLVALGAVTAGLLTYWLCRAIDAPLTAVRHGLGELAMGRYDHRLGRAPRAEFAALYGAFDDTAGALQRRHDSASAEATASLPRR